MSVEKRGILLFAHGASDPEWAEPFERLRETLRSALPGTSVELGFLERMRPGYEEALHLLIAKGCDHVDVFPLFLARGGHLKRDLPRLVSNTPHGQAKVRLQPAIGEVAELMATIADWIAARATR